MGNRLGVPRSSSLATDEGGEFVPAKPVARSREPEPIAKDEPVAPPAPPIWEQHDEQPEAVAEQPPLADELIQTEESAVEIETDLAPAAFVPEELVIEEVPPQPHVILPRKKTTPFTEPRPVEEKKMHAKQEVLQFEPVTRGRFEKSEPTIVEGQDLDIPTFLRKNVRVK